MISIQDKKDCCGCNACVQRCPKQCIVMHEDSEGFLYPRVDESLCIGCGLCEKVCPMLNQCEAHDPLEVLAVKNLNEEERMKSSSGGVFIVLAKSVLAKGGVVFGAVFDENWEVKHTYAETLEGVQKMMGSKYLQSRVEDSFKDAERFLKQGREVLFTGSPCQIAGLKAFLRKSYDNLLAVDFICHGVPSPGVWRRYLQEVKDPSARRAAAGKNSVLNSSLNSTPVITGIEFRDKTLNGWKKFSFVVQHKSASKADQNTVLLSSIHKHNIFMKGFLSDIYLRPSCYECRHKSGKSHSDITIADFWGIDLIMPNFDDDKGVGLVIVHTAKGESIFASLHNMETQIFAKEIINHYNRSYYISANPHTRRAYFFNSFNKTPRKSLSKLIIFCREGPFYVRLWNFFKRVVRWVLPNYITTFTNGKNLVSR